mmetsp:Transcript_18294/g.29321  ORF Transcript_18294/g.29321 Transcript_18294/m.29321 type:complete len:95 (-) Transcript_18294:2113-2397(-)
MGCGQKAAADNSFVQVSAVSEAPRFCRGRVRRPSTFRLPGGEAMRSSSMAGRGFVSRNGDMVGRDDELRIMALFCKVNPDPADKLPPCRVLLRA